MSHQIKFFMLVKTKYPPGQTWIEKPSQKSVCTVHKGWLYIDHYSQRDHHPNEYEMLSVPLLVILYIFFSLYPKYVCRCILKQCTAVSYLYPFDAKHKTNVLFYLFCEYLATPEFAVHHNGPPFPLALTFLCSVSAAAAAFTRFPASRFQLHFPP